MDGVGSFQIAFTLRAELLLHAVFKHFSTKGMSSSARLQMFTTSTDCFTENMTRTLLLEYNSADES